ncbi:MAG: hypothetical protein RLZZ127_3061, partial [Planctomycetota bacterium]
RLIEGGGVAIGDDKVTDIKAVVASAPGGVLLLRAGKKRMYRFDLV